jgi:integrase
MGRRSLNGGVLAKGSNRIQFDFEIDGVRYRPTLERAPSAANLRRAAKQLEAIKKRIAEGTFNFADEFPNFRNLETIARENAPRTCNVVFDEFMTHCQSRMERNDMAFATFDGYRKIFDSVWRPEIGSQIFDQVRHSQLVKIADARKVTKKTYNNVVSPLRCAFEYGYRDHPERHNPAIGLKGFRITKKDRPVVNPFSIQEAEVLIGQIHRDWGEAQGNYDEFRFFTGLRPSEEIALLVSDCDLASGKISVTKACVLSRDKDRTKTSTDRVVELCPRALQVLKRHLAFRAGLKLAGKIRHDHLFFMENGEPIRNLNYPWVRWRSTLQLSLKTRYREPYCARHSSVSWNLMIGKNHLWVAKQHGHGVQTMLETYAAWIEGATQSDIEMIKSAMEGMRTVVPFRAPAAFGPLKPPKFGTRLALAPHAKKLSIGEIKENHGGEGGIRTLDGLLTRLKILRNQEVTDDHFLEAAGLMIQFVAVPAGVQCRRPFTV